MDWKTMTLFSRLPHPRDHSAALEGLFAVRIKRSGLRDRHWIGRREGILQRVIKRRLLALACDLAVVALARFTLPLAIHFDYSRLPPATHTLPDGSNMVSKLSQSKATPAFRVTTTAAGPAAQPRRRTLRFPPKFVTRASSQLIIAAADGIATWNNRRRLIIPHPRSLMTQ